MYEIQIDTVKGWKIIDVTYYIATALELKVYYQRLYDGKVHIRIAQEVNLSS